MDDSPENSPNPARAAAAKAYHAKRKQKAEEAAAGGAGDESWFELTGTKVVKKTKKANGMVYTVYVSTRKQADEQKLDYRK